MPTTPPTYTHQTLECAHVPQVPEGFLDRPLKLGGHVSVLRPGPERTAVQEVQWGGPVDCLGVSRLGDRRDPQRRRSLPHHVAEATRPHSCG